MKTKMCFTQEEITEIIHWDSTYKRTWIGVNRIANNGLFS